MRIVKKNITNDKRLTRLKSFLFFGLVFFFAVSCSADTFRTAVEGVGGGSAKKKDPLVFIDGVSPSPVLPETITVEVNVPNVDEDSLKYGYVDDPAKCDGDEAKLVPAPAPKKYKSGEPIVINDETGNGLYVCVIAKDKDGNTHTLISGHPLNVDKTPPTLSFTVDVVGTLAKKESVTIKAKDKNLDVSSLKYGFSIDTDCKNLAPEKYTQSFTNEQSFDITDDSQSGKYICAIAKDSVGNVTYVASNKKLNIDNTPPVISYDKDVDQGPVGTDIVRITVQDANPESTSYLAGYVDKKEDCSASSLGTTLADYKNNLTAPSDLPFSQDHSLDINYNGKYFCAVAQDKLKHTTYQVSKFPVNIDASRPGISYAGLQTTYTKKATVTIQMENNGTTVKQDTLQYKFISSTESCDKNQDFSSAVLYDFNAAGINLNETETGKHICARVQNTLGNWGYGVSGKIKIDKTAPVVNFIETVLAGPVQNNRIIVQLTEDHLESGTFKYDYIDGTNISKTKALEQCYALSTTKDLLPLDGQNRSTFNAATNKNGHYICVVAIDEAGNKGIALSSRKLNIDNQKPTIVINPDLLATAVKTGHFKITVTDDNLIAETNPPTASHYGYGFATDQASCNENFPVTNGFVNGRAEDIETEDHNKKYLCVVVQDAAGNIAVKASANPVKVDRKPPTITIDPDVLANAVAKMVVTIKAQDPVSGIKTLKWGFSTDAICSDADSYTNTYKADGSLASEYALEDQNGHYLCAKAEDNLGHISYKRSAHPVNIDATAPKIVFTNNVAQGPRGAETVVLTVTESNPKANSYKYAFVSDKNSCATSMSDSSFTKEFVSGQAIVFKDNSHNGKYICAKAEDKFNRKSMVVSEYPLNIDTSTPGVAITGVSDKWVKSNTATITVTGNNVTNLQYVLTSTATCDSTTNFSSASSFTNGASIVFNNQATYNGKYICAQAKNSANNNIGYGVSSQLKIDTTAPTIVFTDNISVGPVQKDTVIIKVTEVNLASGFRKYSFVNEANQAAAQTACQNFDFSQAGAIFNDDTQTIKFANESKNGQYLCVGVQDEAGNKTTIVSDHPLNIDITPPVLKVVEGISGSPATSESITIKITETNLKQAKYFYIDGASNTHAQAKAACDAFTTGSAHAIPLPNNTAVSLDNNKDNHYVCAVVDDNAGNKSTLLSANKINIDNTPPVITFVNNVDSNWVSNADLKIKVTDAKSTVNNGSLKYAFVDTTAACIASPSPAFTETFVNENIFSLTSESHNGKFVCAVAKDNLGNTSYQTSANALKIDKTPPVISLGNVPTTLSNRVELTFSASDTKSGIDTASLKYGFVNSASDCHGSNSSALSHTPSSGKIIVSNDIDHNKYICTVAKDSVNNTTYQASNAALQLDTTPPALVTLHNAPSGVSGIEKLDVTVGGTDVSHYKYKLGTNAIDCSSSTGYSGEIPIGTEITTALGSYGNNSDLRLCVMGRDSAGNWQSTAAVANWKKVTDLTVAVARGSSQKAYTNNSSIVFTVTFGRAIKPATFTLPDDLVQSGSSTLSGWSKTTSDNKTFTVSFTATPGTIQLSMLAGKVEDANSANTNIASVGTNNTVEYTLLEPLVTIRPHSGQALLTNAVPIKFDVLFSEKIDASSFVAADITAGVNNELSLGGNVSWEITNPTNDKKTFLLTLKTINSVNSAAGDKIVPALKAGKVLSKAGNPNKVSTYVGNPVVYDNKAPTVSLHGVPANNTNQPNLDVEVKTSNGALTYKYFLGTGNSCSGKTLNKGPQNISQKIQDSLASYSDVNLVLCVAGTDKAGNTGVVTTHTWKKDSTLPTATASNLPKNTNNTKVLNVTVGGTNITHYKYRILDKKDSGHCYDSPLNSFSAERGIGTKIADNILSKADGRIRLCLLGKNASGVWQEVNAVTVYNWVKDTAGPKVVSAETLDNNENGKIGRYKLTFDKAVKDSTFVASSWQVHGHGHSSVQKVAPAGSDAANDNVLYIVFNETAAGCNQSDLTGCDTGNKPDITIAANGIQDIYGNAIAKTESADIIEIDRAQPILVYAKAQNDLSVHLYFSENMSAKTTECGAGSQNPLVQCSTLYGISGGITISKAVLESGTSNGNTVVLTTTKQTTNTDYTATLTASKMQDVNNNNLRDSKKTAAFKGGTQVTTVVSATAISNTKVKVVFNQNVNAGTAANYTIPGLTVSEAVKDSSDTTGKTVILTTSSQTSDTTNGYRLTVSTAHASGNTANFTGDKRPDVAAASSINITTVQVRFSEDVNFTQGPNGALNLSNYCIETTATVSNNCTGTKLAVTAVASQTADNTVKLTTHNQNLNTLYTITVKNVQDKTGNDLYVNRAKFFGQEELKILTARRVSTSSSHHSIFRVTFSKPFVYGSGGAGTNSAGNLANWSFPAAMGAVTVCTAADDNACPNSYTQGQDTEIFFKAIPKPTIGAYTIVGATAANSPTGAKGCLLPAGAGISAPNNCLKTNPNDRAVVAWELPTIVEDGPVYNDPFNDRVTLSGQVVKYNDKLLIGPNDADTGLFMTELNMQNPENIILDSKHNVAGIQPFKDNAKTRVYESGSIPLAGIDYMYAACAHNVLGKEIDHTLSGTACTAAGGTERLYIVGYTEDPNSCYQSVWITEDKISPFTFKHIQKVGCVAKKSFRAMSLRMFQGYIYQASQMQGDVWAPLTSVYSPTGLLGGQESIGAVANNYNDPLILRQVGTNGLFDLSWGLVTRIGGEGNYTQLPKEKRVNGSAGFKKTLTSVDTMFVYKGDNTPARMYIANGGWVSTANLTNKTRPIPTAKNQQTTEGYVVDGGIVRSAHSTTDGITSGYGNAYLNPDLLYVDKDDSKGYDQNKKYLQANVRDGGINRHWEDVTPGANHIVSTSPATGTIAYIWNMFMSKALPKSASSGGDWQHLVPKNTITPSIKAIPKMVEFKGDLYVIRNACASNTVLDLSSSVHDTCPVGMERPQLWRLPNNCGKSSGQTALASDCQAAWKFIGNTTSADSTIQYTTRMGGAVWKDGNGQAQKTAKNQYITLLEVAGDYLYVGFDNAEGVNLWRTNKSNPTQESDFEAVCQTGNNCFQPEKQFGMTTSTVKTDIKFFDSIGINEAGKDYLIFNSRGGSNPLRIYRQSND